MTASSLTGLANPSIASFPYSMKCTLEAGHEVVDDPGDQDLAGRGAGSHPLRYVQGEARNRSVAQIDLAGMHSSGEREFELLRSVPERDRAADGTRGPVEVRSDLFAARSNQMTAVACNGFRRSFAQPIDALAPKAVAKPGSEPLRAHQAGDHKRGQNPFSTLVAALPRQELFDLVGEAVHVAGPDRMVAPG